MNDNNEPKVWASLGQTINMGNFENIKIDIGLSGIPINCTPDFLESQLGAASKTLQEIVYRLATELQARAREVRGGANG